MRFVWTVEYLDPNDVPLLVCDAEFGDALICLPHVVGPHSFAQGVDVLASLFFLNFSSNISVSSVATLFGVGGLTPVSAAGAMFVNRGGGVTLGGGCPLGLTILDFALAVDGPLGDKGASIMLPENLVAGSVSGSGALVDSRCFPVADFAGRAVGKSLTGGAFGGGPEGGLPFCPMANGSV